ncbi:MAG: serine/threonine-protein phosphatase [Desulfobacteraceae bacterium]|nr:serine/threonine-protein phosphatase [Desulfobacteraceae bacterium]
MKESSRTDTGKRRDHNEDSIMIDDRRDIYLLADGMGGHKAGEMASKMAVEVAYEFLAANTKEDIDNKDIPSLLAEALLKAHNAIKVSEKIDLEFKGMGTTLVIMMLRGAKAYICHVGDSRAYHISSSIKQITKDQTLGNHLIDTENRRPEDIPNKAWHTLIQAVGVSKKIIPASNEVELQTGDIILLCSDGLTDMLSDAEIEEIIKDCRDNNFKETANLMVEEANRKGGKDNISVIAVQYQKAGSTFWQTLFGTLF